MAEDMLPQPSVCQMVHYQTNDGRCWAAVITEVVEGTDVHLHVFPPGGHALAANDVPQGTDNDTWHWPERT